MLGDIGVHGSRNATWRVGLLPLNKAEKQMQILRLTTPHLHPSDEDLSLGTPGLKSVWGSVRSLMNRPEKQMQILRLTTPKLKCAWGPFRSG